MKIAKDEFKKTLDAFMFQNNVSEALEAFVEVCREKADRWRKTKTEASFLWQALGERLTSVLEDVRKAERS